MKSRVAEEQAPGYLTRLETLAELEKKVLAAEKTAGKGPKSDKKSTSDNAEAIADLKLII